MKENKNGKGYAIWKEHNDKEEVIYEGNIKMKKSVIESEIKNNNVIIHEIKNWKRFIKELPSNSNLYIRVYNSKINYFWDYEYEKDEIEYNIMMNIFTIEENIFRQIFQKRKRKKQNLIFEYILIHGLNQKIIENFLKEKEMVKEKWYILWYILEILIMKKIMEKLNNIMNLAINKYMKVNINKQKKKEKNMEKENYNLKGNIYLIKNGMELYIMKIWKRKIVMVYRRILSKWTFIS